MMNHAGPQVAGGTYFNGYWQDTYTVEAMWSRIDGREVWLSVRWSDGRRTTHCTPWDARRDLVVTS